MSETNFPDVIWDDSSHATDLILRTSDQKEILRVWYDSEVSPIQIRLAENDGVKFIDTKGDAIVPPPKPKRQYNRKAQGIARNWAIRKSPRTGKNRFYVWRDKEGERITVSLPVWSKPGLYTPQNFPEIIGQDEMIFALAIAIKTKKRCLFAGPTGTGKTSLPIWLGQILNYNVIEMSINRSTEASHFIGEYKPTGTKGEFKWSDGPLSLAVRQSQSHPTILILDELNRIGHQAELSRTYSLLTDQMRLEIPEHRMENGESEIIFGKQLSICATINPSDYEDDDYSGANYIGIQDLDPALESRFEFRPKVNYPAQEIEKQTLVLRVEGLDPAKASLMVDAARRIRTSDEVRFPISFRELEAWALLLPYYSYKEAAELTVIEKAPPSMRADIRSLLYLQTGKN